MDIRLYKKQLIELSVLSHGIGFVTLVRTKVNGANSLVG